MISILSASPENVAAFYTLGETTKEEFETRVLPHVQKKVSDYQQLNYMLYINECCNEYSLELLLKESIQNLEKICSFNRFAIVSSLTDTDLLSKFFATLPNYELKIFSQRNVYDALYWCHNGKSVA